MNSTAASSPPLGSVAVGATNHPTTTATTTTAATTTTTTTTKTTKTKTMSFTGSPTVGPAFAELMMQGVYAIIRVRALV